MTESWRYFQIDAWRNCFKSKSSSDVAEETVKNEMPRARQNSRIRWQKFRTVCS